MLQLLQPEALTTFSGLAHRFQLALEHNGVRWINDSKATNVGSTEAALNGLHVDGTLHLLLGGDGKSADFSSLKPYLAGDNVRLYCFGVTAASWLNCALRCRANRNHGTGDAADCPSREARRYGAALSGLRQPRSIQEFRTAWVMSLTRLAKELG